MSYEDNVLAQFIERTYHHRGGLPVDYLTDGFYDLCECRDCGVLFQSCIPSGKLLELIYNPTFDPSVQMRKSHFKEARSMRFVESDARQVGKFLRNRKNPSVLDYGVGYGIFASFLIDIGIEVYGTELNEKAIGEAKSKGVRIISEDEIVQMKFDFVNTDQVLEHVINPREVLKILSGALRENGALKISVPNAKMISRDLRKLSFANPKTYKAMTPLQHINVFPDRAMEYIADCWGMTFTKPIQFDRKYPIYTLSRTLKRSLSRNVGAGWFHKSSVSNFF